MIGWRGKTDSQLGSVISAARASLAAVLMLAAPAMAQNPNAAPQPALPLAPQEQAPPPAAPPDPSYKPGFIDALGQWLGQSRARLDSQLKSTQDALKSTHDALKSTQDAIDGFNDQAAATARDAAGIAQQATGAIVGNIPKPRIVTGRQRCAMAPNGGADCTSAAEALCRGGGFGTGRGLDVHAVDKCPTWVWLAGRSNYDSKCHNETYVTRALCQ
jgi:hypothetical protein